MSIIIIKDKITRDELREIAKERFGDLVKGAVDIEKGIIALGGELHIDEEVALVEQEGSKQENVWGINLYPDRKDDEFIEFDSMINIKPNFGNRTRSVDDGATKSKIKQAVGKLIQ